MESQEYPKGHIVGVVTHITKLSVLLCDIAGTNYKGDIRSVSIIKFHIKHHIWLVKNPFNDGLSDWTNTSSNIWPYIQANE